MLHFCVRRSHLYIYLIFTNIQSIRQASLQNRVSIVSYLIDSGANLYCGYNNYSYRGTPLHFAMSFLHPNITIVRLILGNLSLDKFPDIPAGNIIADGSHTPGTLQLLLAAGAKDHPDSRLALNTAVTYTSLVNIITLLSICNYSQDTLRNVLWRAKDKLHDLSENRTRGVVHVGEFCCGSVFGALFSFTRKQIRHTF